MDLKFIRENPDELRKLLTLRRVEFDLDRLLGLDAKRRSIAQERDKARHEQRKISERVSSAKREGKNCAEIVVQARGLSDRVKEFETELARIERELTQLIKTLPNSVHSSVTAKEELISEWGEPPKFSFEPLAHWDLGEALDILDFKAAARLSGSRFVVFKDAGALLERALISYFLDTHTRNGYVEIYPPVLANPACLEGGGQLPHLETDMYAMRDDPFYLIPTAETALINIHRGQVLDSSRFPLKYVAYTPCFRREAGSYGKDVRGMIRIHQFDKVELVRFTRPEDSYEALEEMRVEVEGLMQALGIPYRVKRLAAWDVAYQSAKTYDIDAWAAGVKRWLEVSSISNCEDYQTRRTNTRFRNAQSKLVFPHTLNGSGLALPRTFIAIIENNQQPDGSVVIPEVLRPYMAGLERIS
ncbi:serine--tRNA ligase [candidate division WOR-3 bacterium JGI_Cruoil_03_51_56]|uniref:Serine--tRNA ligase n=1 Tax=candidate division WOR-3 bacterium JGI_Cruoil_03_51_56 TaxID=1973747 RepID=A0A235BRW0_UNCW3|nr:MAG: serine--tRNA ligase [candidate division WOR-3 bacterium JGI_Cruoil_03_51_56]